MPTESTTTTAMYTRKLERYYNGKPPPLVATYDTLTSASTLFERPTLKVNPRQSDGYRSPSSYYGLNRQLVWKADLFAQTVEVNGKDVDYNTLSGDIVRSLNLDAGASEIRLPSWQNELRTKVLVNLKDEILDAAMVVAEIEGTAKTLVTNLGRLARSIDAIKQRKPESVYFLFNGRRRDNRRPTDKFLRETASAYLEWKYGIMPTVYDIQGACKALDINESGSLFDNPPLLVARAAMRGSWTQSVKLPMVDKLFVDGTLEVRAEGRARVDYSIDSEGLRGLSRYGIGLGTVATVAFERTPFSFVLNMAFPIADLIKAWTSVSAGCKVRGYTETIAAMTKLKAGSGRFYWRGGDALAIWQATDPVVRFTRLGSNEVPMPLPFIRNPIKVGNLASVLALFTQLRKP